MSAVIAAGAGMPARSFELAKILVLDIENLTSQANTVRMIQELCPSVEDTRICKLEFEIALQQFAIVGLLLKRAAITHTGEQREKIITRARNAHERGELLYQLAIVQNAPPVSPDLIDAAKLLAKPTE